MAYTVSIDTGEGYMRFELAGTLTKEEIDSAMAEVLALRKEHGISRILCDQRRLTTPPDDTRGFLTAMQFGTEPYAGIKLAIIRNRAREERLFDIASSNRGVPVKIFDDEEQAKRWLLVR
jgi:hypothetical protein